MTEDLESLSVENIWPATSVKHLWKDPVDGVVLLFGRFWFVGLFSVVNLMWWQVFTWSASSKTHWAVSYSSFLVHSVLLRSAGTRASCRGPNPDEKPVHHRATWKDKTSILTRTHANLLAVRRHCNHLANMSPCAFQIQRGSQFTDSLTGRLCPAPELLRISWSPLSDCVSLAVTFQRAEAIARNGISVSENELEWWCIYVHNDQVHDPRVCSDPQLLSSSCLLSCITCARLLCLRVDVSMFTSHTPHSWFRLTHMYVYR